MDTKNKHEAFSLLKMLVNTNTVNPPGNEDILSNKICSYLSEKNIHLQKIHVDTNRSSIIAHIKGSGILKPLILCGHMDTVPYGDKNLWKYSPEQLTVVDNRYYGRGTSDMKSGLAAMMYAFKSIAQKLQQNNAKPKGDIYFVATADEETHGLGAQKIAPLLPLVNSMMFIAEPSNNNIGLCSKGTLWLKFNISGKSSHGAYPEKGINAVNIAYELHHLLDEYCNLYYDELLGHSTCTITGINGGTKLNMVPDSCTIQMDIRTVPQLNNNLFLAKIDTVCCELTKKYIGLDISFAVLNNRPAVKIDKNHEMVNILADIWKTTTGNEPVYRGINFFSDASIFVQHTPDLKCILFGPGRDDNAHITDEYVEKNAYFTSIVCYNKLLVKYLS